MIFSPVGAPRVNFLLDKYPLGVYNGVRKSVMEGKYECRVQNAEFRDNGGTDRRVRMPKKAQR